MTHWLARCFAAISSRPARPTPSSSHSSGPAPSWAERRSSRQTRRRLDRARALPSELEERALLVAWVAQGPGPVTGGQIENVPGGNPVSGAIHTVLAHPTNADILYLGSVNGGIWRTNNARAASPNWTPLTDNLPTLSIGAMAMDPTNPNNILAGLGRFSSFGGVSGTLNGLLLTRDGGANWTQLTDPLLVNKNFGGVTIRGNTLLAAARAGNDGLFRSVDGGTTWARINGAAASGFPNGQVLDLVSDPSNANRYYAAVQDVGVFRSDDAGATWVNVSQNDAAGLQARITGGGNNNTEMAVGRNGRIYVAVIVNGQCRHIGFSDNQGTTWAAMDLPQTNDGGTTVGLNPRVKPGSQGSIHFSIAVDPNVETTVYVGGDRQPDPFPNFIGARNYSGRLFRGDTTVAATGATPSPQWEHLTHSNAIAAIPGGGTASGSSPHADSREMTFNALGELIETDDGGIYRRTNPQNNTGDWFSLNGDLQVAEFHDIAYDTVSNMIVAGSQDNGSSEQSVVGGVTWRIVNQGDGGDVAVDTLMSPGNSVRYTSAQNLLAFQRRTINAAGAVQATATPALTLLGGATPTMKFVTPIEVNAVVGGRVIIGASNGTYESLNGGDSIREVGSGIGVNDDAISYGGRGGGVDNPDVLYVGSNSRVFVRTATGGPLTQSAAYNGGFVEDIVLDPDDWRTAYVTTATAVFQTTDAGASWTNITGNLTALTGGVEAIEYIATATADAIVVGGTNGVFYALAGAPTVWTEMGTALPNAITYDLDYDPADDVLIVGTMGRGAWSLPNASTEFTVFTGSARGVVYNDLNGDGARQGGEPGLAGVTVFADLDNSGGLSAGDISASSSATGAYQLDNLPGGVAFNVLQVVPANHVQTQPTGGGGYNVTIVSANQIITGRNFGNQAVGAVRGVVYRDDNQSGTRQAGEPGLAGFVVYLDANNNGTREAGETFATSAADGSYTLSAPVGSHVVRQETPFGYRVTAPPGGLYNVTINTAGQTISNRDFGNFRQTATVSGVKFSDNNGNGVRNAGEAGLAGFTIFIDANNNGVLNAGEVSTVTAADGSYTLTTPIQTTAQIVREVPRPNYQQTAPAAGFHSVLLNTEGQTATGRDFGNRPTGSISGVVYRDDNQSGTRQAAEPGLAGFVVYLDANGNNTRDAGETFTTSAADGSYTLTALAGANRVRQETPFGFRLTAPAGGVHVVTIATAGQIVINRDFGNFRQTGEIRGVKFADLNGSGTRQAGEAGLAGFTIFADANNNGALDAGEDSTVSAADGTYRLRVGIRATAQAIREVQQPNYLATAPAGGFHSVLVNAENQIVTGRDFGNRPTGSVRGVVFDDRNRSGTRQAGEPGLAGITVFVDANRNGRLDAGESSAVTSAAGGYVLNNVVAGTHHVRQVAVPGITQIAPANNGPNVVTITTAGQSVTADFADFNTLRPGFISGKVYNDLNGNGRRDANEPGLAGVWVYLDLNDNTSLGGGEPAQRSDANGDYTIDLRGTALNVARQFTVRQVVPFGFVQTQPAGFGAYVINYVPNMGAAALEFGDFRPGGDARDAAFSSALARAVAPAPASDSTSVGGVAPASSVATSTPSGAAGASGVGGTSATASPGGNTLTGNTLTGGGSARGAIASLVGAYAPRFNVDDALAALSNGLRRISQHPALAGQDLSGWERALAALFGRRV